MKITHKYIKALFYAGIYILLFLMFQKQIGDLLWAANNQWLIDCEPAFCGVLMLILSIFILYLLYKHNLCQFGHHLISLCIFSLFLYWYYRWHEEGFFTFWGINAFGVDIAYADLVIPTAIAAFLQQIFAIWKSSHADQDKKTPTVLTTDDPLKKGEADVLGFRDIAKNLIDDLEGVDLKERSYSVGITGEWGMGKSSLFTIFEEELEKKEHTLVYTFYPRSSASVQEIQQDFFDGFADTLSKHHTGVRRVIKLYQEALQIIDITWLSRIFSLFSSLTAEAGKERVNEIIKETGDRIFVLVDDLDRLTAPEILEVMKLIDRNGDFINTIFITAYDKDYINEVLKNHLKMGEKTDYSDKYFSYEFALPVQTASELNKLARRQIQQSVGVDGIDVEYKDELIKQWDEIGAEIVVKLHTIRHVKRFMNLLLSRYVKVRDDVNFKDFAYVTLLRYKDLSVYHGLIEGRFVERGTDTKHYNCKVFYLKDGYQEELMNCSKWEGSKEILEDLFKSEDDLSLQEVSSYQRLRSVRALPNYYYDYKPGVLYYLDLIRMYQAGTNREAFVVMDELLRDEDSNENVSQERYQSVEDFLVQRPLAMLHSMAEFKRLIVLLFRLIRYSKRTEEVHDYLMSLMTSRMAAQMVETDHLADYILDLKDAIENIISEFPLELGLVLLKINYIMLKGNVAVKDYLFSQKQIIEWANSCQLYYINYHMKEVDHNVIAKIVELSRIYDSNNKITVTTSAQMELLKYMGEHPDEFASFVCNVYKETEEKDLTICYNNSFIPKYFFPYDGLTFEKWVREKVKNDSLKNLLLLIERTKSDHVSIELRPEESNVDVKDFDEVWNVIKLRQDENDEQKLMNVIKKNKAVSLVMLSKETRMKKDVVKSMIHRLVEKGELSEKWNDIPETIPAFEVGDFVRLKDTDINKIKYLDREPINIYKVLKLENGKYKLSSIESLVDSNDVEAIPIDGFHDRNIYFDPIIMASIVSPGGSIPVHSTDYSYYMDKFEDCLDENKRSYSEIVKERGYHFVHEVQHWLRKEYGSDMLKKRY